MIITGPLFKWFGSKWLSSKTLPAPRYDTIVEPFAGGAGYSLRHSYKHVHLCEQDPWIYKLWCWLIYDASRDDILKIPIDNREGLDIREIGMSEGQEILLKSWQRTNNVGDCWTISKWGNLPGQWTANTRARVASEVQFIKHWTVSDDAFRCLGEHRNEANTWFIDPPYQYNYQYLTKRAKPLDYAALSDVIGTLQGQIVVCEAVCQKTGKVPSWLPFEPFGLRPTSRRKAGNNHYSKELIYER